MSRSAARPLLVALLVGSVLGLALFGAEVLLLLRSGAVGVQVDVRGPYAALMAAVRPLLPLLLVRVALAYLAAGAFAGLLAHALARAFGRGGALATAGTWLVLLVLLAWDRALARPALFDDLPFGRGLLASLVDGGARWQPRAAALVLVGGALGVLAGRRRFGPLALAGGLAAVGALVLAWPRLTTPRVAERRPLVVLIGVDALRPDRLAALGGARGVAPHIDRLVADGALFTRAYTPIAQTEPAWRALLTARWPHQTGVRYPLTPESRLVLQPTFAERFTRAGWRTVFATDCSRFHFETEASGFATRLQPPRGAVNFLLEKLRFRGVGMFGDHALGALWLPEFVDNRALAGVHDPFGYADRLAARLVREASRGPTLFAFHATAAHFPGDPSYPFYRRYVPAGTPLEQRLRMTFRPIDRAGQADGAARATAEALYDELLAQADAQVGQLLGALERAGLYDDAWVVLFSDHGESFHEDRPDLAGATPVHGARLGDIENHIVLAVKPPRALAHPARVDALVRLVDVGPTLLAAAGLPALEGVEGQSLLPLVRGEPGFAERPLYAETGLTHVLPEVLHPGHREGTPRTFDMYRLRPDGVAEVRGELHEALVGEKDRGAFDGRAWVVDRPRADGTVERTCTGACPAPALGSWLDGVLGKSPPPLTAGVR